MPALRPAVEIEMVRPIKVGKALGFIVHGMAVDDVHHHGDSLSMGIIHQALELFRRSETRRQSEEIRHLVAE